MHLLMSIILSSVMKTFKHVQVSYGYSMNSVIFWIAFSLLLFLNSDYYNIDIQFNYRVIYRSVTLPFPSKIFGIFF